MAEANQNGDTASTCIVVAPGLLSARPTNPTLTSVANLLSTLSPNLLIVTRSPRQNPATGPTNGPQEAELEVVRRLRSDYTDAILICTPSDGAPDDTGHAANLAAADVVTCCGATHLSAEWILTWHNYCAPPVYVGGAAIAAARRARKSVICLGSPASCVIRETIQGSNGSTTLWGVEMSISATRGPGAGNGSIVVVDHSRSSNPEIVDIDRHGSFAYLGGKFGTLPVGKAGWTDRPARFKPIRDGRLEI